jgi:hypothetical protein
VAAEPGVALEPDGQVGDMEVGIALALEHHQVHLGVCLGEDLGHRIGEAGRLGSRFGRAQAHVVLDDLHLAARLGQHQQAWVMDPRRRVGRGGEHHVHRLFDAGARWHPKHCHILEEFGVEGSEWVLLRVDQGSEACPPQLGVDFHTGLTGQGARRGEILAVAAVQEYVEAAGEDREADALDLLARDLRSRRCQRKVRLGEAREVGVAPGLQPGGRKALLAEAREGGASQLLEPCRPGRALGRRALCQCQQTHPAAPCAGSTSSQP